MSKCEFSVEMWVGLEISEEKICIFGKKMVGPENVEEKRRNFRKKFVGGSQINPGTNFRHTFRKFLPDPIIRVFFQYELDAYFFFRKILS